MTDVSKKAATRIKKLKDHAWNNSISPTVYLSICLPFPLRISSIRKTWMVILLSLPSVATEEAFERVGSGQYVGSGGNETEGLFMVFKFFVTCVLVSCNCSWYISMGPPLSECVALRFEITACFACILHHRDQFRNPFAPCSLKMGRKNPLFLFTNPQERKWTLRVSLSI